MFPVGRLIEVCGIDGAGKSTFIQDINTALISEGRKVTILRPVSGDPTINKFLDELDAIKKATDCQEFQERIDKFKSEYYLLTFLNHKAIVDRLLLEDYDILCDRYLFSFKTYQECFNQNNDQDQELLKILPEADVTFLLIVPVDLAMSRIEAKGNPAPYENPIFLEKAQQVFLKSAPLQPNLIYLHGDDARAINIKKALFILKEVNDSDEEK